MTLLLAELFRHYPEGHVDCGWRRGAFKVALRSLQKRKHVLCIAAINEITPIERKNIRSARPSA
jgi:hypothetical protein